MQWLAETKFGSKGSEEMNQAFFFLVNVTRSGLIQDSWMFCLHLLLLTKQITEEHV